MVSAFALLFLAELGDKTQLMTMTLAHRYPVRPVLAGVFAAFLLLNLLAVLLGAALYRYLPQSAVLLAAALLFLYFAWRSWREADDTEAQEDVAKMGARGAFISSFVLIFVAELGDKTQLALIALAASSGALWSVFTGGTLALWTVSAIGVFLGSTLLRKIPPHWMHRIAALLFAFFGLLALATVLLDNLL